MKSKLNQKRAKEACIEYLGVCVHVYTHMHPCVCQGACGGVFVCVAVIDQFVLIL